MTFVDNFFDCIYLGKDITVTEKFKVHIPTIREIFEFGESDYYSLINFFTATPTDLKVELDSFGVDWNKVDDWDVFYNYIFPSLKNSKQDSENFKKFLIGFDAQEFERAIDNETNELVILKAPNNDVRIDRVVYTVLCDALRQANYLTKNVAYAMNEATRLWMIQDDKDEREKAKREGYKSRLAPLISSMVNSSGFKYNYDTVQDLNLYLFMDAVRRILKIDGYKNLMTGIYSGTIDAKKIRNKKEFNWMGEIK